MTSWFGWVWDLSHFPHCQEGPIVSPRESAPPPSSLRKCCSSFVKWRMLWNWRGVRESCGCAWSTPMCAKIPNSFEIVNDSLDYAYLFVQLHLRIYTCSLVYGISIQIRQFTQDQGAIPIVHRSFETSRHEISETSRLLREARKDCPWSLNAYV